MPMAIQQEDLQKIEAFNLMFFLMTFLKSMTLNQTGIWKTIRITR